MRSWQKKRFWFTVSKKAVEFSDPGIARRFQMELSVAGCHTDSLLKRRLIIQTRFTDPSMFETTGPGRKYVVENGLA